MGHHTKKSDMKRDAKKTAKQLYYPDDVLEKIDSAKDEYEISRILKNARLRDED